MAPVMTIGQLNDELGLLGTDPIQHYGRSAVKTITLHHGSEYRVYPTEHGNVGKMLGPIAVNDDRVSL